MWRVAEIGRADQHQREERQRPAMLQREAQHALVSAHERGPRCVIVAVAGAAGAADEVVAESGRPGERERQRSEQRHAYRDGQRAEEDAVHAGHRDQRQENDDRRDRGAEQRHADFADGAANGLRARLARIAMHHDVLHHHDGVVDHQPDGGGETAQRHQVEALAQQAQRDERDRDGGGNHQAGDERSAPIAQEQHHDQRGQHEAQQDGVAHALDGFVDDLRLIVEGFELHALRQRLRGCFRFRRGRRPPPARYCCRAGGKYSAAPPACHSAVTMV